MSSLEQRVAYLEGRMEDHAALFADIRAELRGLRVEVRGELMALRTEMDRRSTWMIGLLVGILMGLVGLAFQISRLQAL
jgi:hypothetical protein